MNFESLAKSYQETNFKTWRTGHLLKIYTKRTFCSACRQTKLLLNKQGTKFEEIVVEETDEEMLQHLRDSGFSQFPVVIADGVTWCGFRPDRLKLLV